MPSLDPMTTNRNNPKCVALAKEAKAGAATVSVARVSAVANLPLLLHFREWETLFEDVAIDVKKIVQYPLFIW